MSTNITKVDQFILAGYYRNWCELAGVWAIAPKYVGELINNTTVHTVCAFGWFSERKETNLQ
jgi:hypothetical protein